MIADTLRTAAVLTLAPVVEALGLELHLSGTLAAVEAHITEQAREIDRADAELVEALRELDGRVTRALEGIAPSLPCRTIHGELGPYLSRYTLRELPNGSRVYLHFFHRGDADHELHNHPWAGSSLILAGGYREQRLAADGTVETRELRPGHKNDLAPDTFHRVDLLDEAAGCWTLFTTGAKAQSWGFLDVATRVFTPWRDALRKRGLLNEETGLALDGEPEPRCLSCDGRGKVAVASSTFVGFERCLTCGGLGEPAPQAARSTR